VTGKTQSSYLIVVFVRLLSAVSAAGLLACSPDPGESTNNANPSDAGAETTVISTSLNGVEQLWRINNGQSDWKAFRSGQTIGTANLYSFAVANEKFERSDVLSIGFALTNTPDGYGVDNAEVSIMMRSAGSGSFSSANDGSAQISIESATEEGGSMRIVGNFSGRLPFRLHSSRDAESSNVLVIDNGQFDVSLEPLSR